MGGERKHPSTPCVGFARTCNYKGLKRCAWATYTYHICIHELCTRVKQTFSSRETNFFSSHLLPLPSFVASETGHIVPFLFEIDIRAFRGQGSLLWKELPGFSKELKLARF